LGILNGKLKEKRRFEDTGVNGEDSINVNLEEINKTFVKALTTLFYISTRPSSHSNPQKLQLGK